MAASRDLARLDPTNALLPPRRRPRRREEAPPNHERWLVSYADFITLLFAFFTTMYAISTVDAKKLGSMVGAMQQAFETGKGPRADAHGRRAVPPPSNSTSEAASARETDLAELQDQLLTGLTREIQAKRVDVEMDRRGLVISINEAGSFPAGSADLSDGARELLSGVAGMIEGIGNQIRVEGHTDNAPIHTPRFASNWDLSAARAINVVQYLLAKTVIPATRLSVAGYAEFHPRESNDTDTSRSRNRRVDVVILNPTTQRAEEPAPSERVR